MNINNLTFRTARGSIIDLEFPAKWHTEMPGLWAMDLTSFIKKDIRFKYLSTKFKKINGNKIEYCKVMINNKYKYLNEKELQEKFANKICYLTVVTSVNEPILDGDFESHRPIRAVIIPEKVDFYD
tara:strand:- start:225 stop:602 length:378 start_codon:yes stop_codon:yes gene_type:complete